MRETGRQTETLTKYEGNRKTSFTKTLTNSK